MNALPARVERAIRGLKAADPAAPLCAYVYDLVQLRAHAAGLLASLPAPCKLYYAIKANPDAPILCALRPVVHGFEAASLGEIQALRRVDREVPILYGGPAKTDAAIEGALAAGVERVHVESAHELRRIEAIGARRRARVPVLLRVNIAGPLPGATLQMAGVPTQFGIDEAEIGMVVDVARRCRHVALQGFHFHSVSNQLDARAHATLVALYLERAREWAGAFDLPVSHVNAGGGLGVNYADTGAQFDWAAFVQALRAVIERGCPPGWTLLFECGRYLTAACGYYVAEILELKRNHGRHFAILRGGSHHFRLPVSWQHSHPFVVVPHAAWPYDFPRPECRTSTITVAGELCTPKDILARDVAVEHVRVGDFLAFPYAGAYGWHISHRDFLSHPYPLQHYLSAETSDGAQEH